MKHRILYSIVLASFTGATLQAQPPATASPQRTLGTYEYEVKPDHEAFKLFNPRKAPSPGPLLLREGDRLAICGDSITEQKMYSRIIETYLCALRDIAMGVAEKQGVRFADIFWPMLQAQVFAPGQHDATPEKPYEVAGRDGIHPGWAGQVVMAWAFLRAMGLDGDIGTIAIDLDAGTASTSEGHRVTSYHDGTVQLVSQRYPFCARGDLNDDQSIRSGMTLVPFTQDLNRFVLRVTGELSGGYRVQWGSASREYTAAELTGGIQLAADFPDNPFCDAFDRVDNAVAAKQAFETTQVKSVFHGPRGRADFQKAVTETESQREPLAAAIVQAMVPVTHTIEIKQITP